MMAAALYASACRYSCSWRCARSHSLAAYSLAISLVTATEGRPPKRNKKADVAEHADVLDHAGLLVNEPPGHAGLPFV